MPIGGSTTLCRRLKPRLTSGGCELTNRNLTNQHAWRRVIELSLQRSRATFTQQPRRPPVTTLRLLPQLTTRRSLPPVRTAAAPAHRHPEKTPDEYPSLQTHCAFARRQRRVAVRSSTSTGHTKRPSASSSNGSGTGSLSARRPPHMAALRCGLTRVQRRMASFGCAALRASARA